jgi:hypothetical protein
MNMGGSGGSYSSDPKKSAEKIREAENESQDKAFESEINEYINSFLSGINERDSEAINKHLETISGALGSEIEGFVKLLFGGSISKHTYIDGLSDVDSLAVINNTELANKNPGEVLKYFEEKLRQRLPKTEISTGNLAITVKFKDNKEIQILPATKTQTGYKIASSDGSGSWSNVVKPKKFAEKLTEINQKNNGKVVPVVKLAKSIISSFPNKRQVSGYHTESLAIEIFKNYSGPQQTKAMLKHFFNEASSKVKTKITDSTGQSLHVDEYLGNNNSVNRQMVSDSLSQIHRKMNNADGKRDKNSWKSFFEE